MLLTGFKDRTDAGQALASRLGKYADRNDVVILGLPRGGLPVAFEIAKELRAPLDVFMVGKLGFPGQPELALGAVTAGGIKVYNRELLEHAGLSEANMDPAANKKILDLERKEARYRLGNPAVPLEDRTVILVDDGTATGASMRAALRALRKMKPKYVVAAVPVASKDGLRIVEQEADETMCLQASEPFYSVGQWYEDFRQVSEEEVIHYLEMSRHWHPKAAPKGKRSNATPTDEPIAVRIKAGGVLLAADLTLPREARGAVLFAHGSGSSRHSPRNRQVARVLNEAGMATLLMDLLTGDEEAADQDTGEYRFDIGLLAERLVDATRWALEDARLAHLKLGYFGASTGAAAALMAAARLPGSLGAVVSRGGRPDLAAEALPKVIAPTLFIVGGEDKTVLDLNRRAMASMRSEKKIEIVPGATHLFEEPGALEEVSRLATEWFAKHLHGARNSDDTT